MPDDTEDVDPENPRPAGHTAACDLCGESVPLEKAAYAAGVSDGVAIAILRTRPVRADIREHPWKDDHYSIDSLREYIAGNTSPREEIKND